MALTKITNSAIADDIGLGGNPTTSTQTAGDSTTRIATTAFVSTAVANLVDSAPETLNTLAELATSIGNNATLSSTLTSSIATKLPLAGGTLTGTLNLGDSVRARFGNGNDLQIYHDGSHSYIQDSGSGNLRILVGDLQIRNYGSNENIITSTSNAEVALYHNASQKLATTATGIDVTGNVDLPDNGKILLGASDDLEIYHDGTNSYIADRGTGNLRLEGTNIALNNQASNKTYLLATDGGSVQLRHNDLTKIETTTTGIDVTGNIGVTGTVDGIDIAARDAVLTSTTTTAGAALPKAGGTMTGALSINSGTANTGLAITSTDTASWLTMTDPTATLFFGNTGGEFALYTGGSEALRVDVNGNVGIGIDTPTARLDVRRGDADGKIAEFHQNAGYGIDIGSSQAVAYISSGYNQRLDFKTDPTSGQTERMSILANGNVGIGTTGPAQKLHVVGSAIIDGGTGVASTGVLNVRQSGDTLNNGIALTSSHATSHRIWKDSTGKLNFGPTSLPSAFVQDLTGKIGIGTASPLHKLAIGGNSTQTLKSTVAITDMTNGASLSLRGQAPTIFFDSTSAGIPTILMDGRGIEFKDGTLDSQGNVDVKIDATGNVGIGTAAPIEKLDVSGYQGISVNANYAHMGSTVSGAMAIFGHNIKSDSGNNIIKSANNGYHSSMIKMYYNEGITFHATAGTQSAGADFYNISGTTNELMRLTNDGNVGIGTTSPTMPLSVKAATNAYAINMHGRSDGYSELYGSSSDGSTKYAFLQTHSAQTKLYTLVNTPLLFGTNSTERMRIDSSGNVGIGTSTGVSDPVSRLNVRAANNHTTGSDREDLVTLHQGISAWQVGRGAGIRWVGDVSRTMAGISSYIFGPEETGLAFETGGAGSTGNLDPTTRMVIDHDGNVGIGTSSPQAKLHVDGTTIFDTATGSQPVYFTRLGNINESLKIHCDDRGAVFESIQDETADTYGNFIFAMDAGVTEPYFDVRKGSADSASIFRVDGGGNVGIGTQSPFSRLQTGGHTFSGGNGMHADARVGISNHGNLTGLMLASTYNDAAHPEYGLVFVQGPSTSSYNVWSVSPDGPAKGDSLNFHYQAQSTNIHSPSNAKVVFDGNGNIAFGGNLHFRTAQDGSFIGPLNTSDLRLAADGNHIFQTYVGGWGTRMEIRDNGIRFPAGDYGVHTTQEHYSNPSSPGSFSTATNTAYTSSTQYWPDQGEKQICVINARAFTKYIHIKTNLTANNIMFYFRTKGYFYSYGMEEQLVGGYTYYSGGNMILSKSNETVAGNTHTGDTYRASDGSLVLKMHVNHTGYTEGKMLVFFHAHAPSTTSAITVTAVTQKDDGTNAF